jgi:hypothetical protein
MRNTLFLEYKFSDHCDPRMLLEAGATHIMAPVQRLDIAKRKALEAAGLIVEPVVALPQDVCPLNPVVWGDIQRQIIRAMAPGQQIVWFDHLRFSGSWEASLASPPGLHADCWCCEGKNRLSAIAALAHKIKKWLPPGMAAGCFTVPIPQGHLETSRQLGQDAVTLGNIFDYLSPMVYHRSLGWSAAQVEFYLGWIGQQVSAQIVPILQVKNFPDGVPDDLQEDEMAAVCSAMRTLGLPPAWFSWDGAVEQGKTEVLARAWRA